MESNIGKKVLDINGTLIVPKRHKRVRKKAANEFTIVNKPATKHSKAVYSVCFSSLFKPKVRGCKNLALYLSKVSDKIILVFNNSDGFPIQERKYDNCIAVYGKELVSEIFKHFEIKGTCATLHLYGNISTNSDMVTFEVGL